MAIQNNKYNNSFIYTIRSPHTDKFYIGSTTQILCKRFANHKSDYSSYVNNKKNYITSFKIIELGDSYIELLEQINCDSKIHLEMREGELIRIHKDLCINKNIVGRTQKQYYADNVDKIKQYQLDNTDNIKQYQEQYRFDNAIEIKQNMRLYRLDNAKKLKEQTKQYHINNADNIKQQQKQYRQDNADKIKQNKKQYHLNNADKIKQYRLDNADKIKQYYINNADKSKQYYIDNADKIKQQKKQYYADNLESIKLRNKKKYQNNKTPKINIAKEDYDFLVYCDKLMNLQYSYKKFIIVE